MAITRIIGCNTIVAVAICGAVSGCSSVQSASNSQAAKTDVAAATVPDAGTAVAQATTADVSHAAAKTDRLPGETTTAATTTPAAVAGAVPLDMASATNRAAQKVGRVTLISQSTDPMQRAAETAANSIAQNTQPVPVPALAVASTAVSQTGGLQAIDMATAGQAITKPLTAPTALSVPAKPGTPSAPLAAPVMAAALPADVTGQFVAIPTPRPRIERASPSSMVAYAGTRQPLSAMSTDFFPPAPGDPLPPTADASNETLSKLIHRYAGMYGVPESLVHRVVHRESKYDPKAYNKRGFWGLMQIKYATAKSMGYQGTPDGLLDAETNLKYAIKYLRGAWLVADNDPDDAIKLYARGYYYDAKRKDMLHVLE
ncbi:lytic transglycosylase domain-containing protein [Rhizobium sp. SL86]|uniref:lytic transglycosylase domain-containing protein n=1 Tax=Rhizobium sp. SL86 TaxID=2995148 RepID=UPI002274AB8C|nr:lytic transglycosylase domain-containing protein [Rhizobium sp. SL86]MCY1669249.1 lytic transglycosylase domain-containing protein [Rhizobium sp. SL86]